MLFILISFTTSATLTGKILDSKNAERLIGASVYLKDTEIGTNSDIDGNYVLFDVSNGKYTVIVRYIGYEDFQTDILISKDTRIIENFETPQQAQEFTIPVSLSIGISLAPKMGTDFDELMRFADKAMYEAKKNNGIHYKYYSE